MQVRDREPDRDAEILWGSVGSFTLSVSLAVVFLAPGWLAALPDCVLKTALGLPCPTCGATRAALALAAGQPWPALAFNPLATLVLLGGTLYLPYAWLVMAGVMRPLRLGWLTAPMPVWVRWTVATALALNWSYLLAVGR